MMDYGSEREGPVEARATDLRSRTDEDEPMGGDPPCWAHLFGEDPGPTAQELEAAAPPDTSDHAEAG